MIFNFECFILPRGCGIPQAREIFAIDPAFAGHAYAWIAHAKAAKDGKGFMM